MAAPQQTLASPDRPVQQCREILLRQLASAIAELDGNDPNVHGARKQLKRARATLRLLRPAIGEDCYRRENITARDAARPLSAVRDQDVLKETLEALAEDLGAKASGVHVAPLHEPQKLTAKRLSDIKGALERAVRRARAWQPEADDWDCMTTALRATYRRARRALRHARQDRATEDLHEWRKQTKYLWHQLQILTPLAAGPIGELADEFHHLSDYLGDEHDLAVLRGRVAASSLTALIDQRRGELQDKALTLGERLYADKSKAFVHRLRKVWADT
jgi:CHAD domain-containing protein